MKLTGQWLEIIINENPSVLESLSPFFFEMGCEGINEFDGSFRLYFQLNRWNDNKYTELKTILNQKNIHESRIITKTIKDENWNENWKENFKSFKVGHNIIVKPDWEKYTAKENELVITIAPKMAFGTGHHETTQLILEQLEEIIKPGMSVLDAGTGSAILAIYCALKGAKKIMAFDNDPVAIENASENIFINKVKNKINLKCCVLKDIETEAYDVIVANINKNILLGYADRFKNYACNRTFLVLSGLLVADREEIIKTYKNEGWNFIRSDTSGEWISLNFLF